jgi:hypothetical protein
LEVDGLGNQGTLTTYDYGLENPSVVQGTARFSAASNGLVLTPESIKIIVGTVGKNQPNVSIRVRI